MMRAQSLPLAICLLATGASACTPDLPGGGRTLEAGRYTLMVRPVPAKIPFDEPFSLLIAVCANAGTAPPATLSVDAQMPEHKHGMNYKPGIKSEGAGRYRADGLLFHMPGRWELTFELRADGRSERASYSEVIE